MISNKTTYLFFLMLAALLSACTEKNSKKLPIIGEREAVEKLVDGKTVVDTVYHQIPNFTFLNQDSTLITDKDFESKVYVANFFFTHCPSICPTMQRNLLKVYEKYKGNEKVAFLSHSIDFKYDSPSVLKSYATKLGVDNAQWQFVTGSKKDIYGIAEKYLVYTKEDAAAPGGYDHQGYLVLIDQQKRIRGAYDGTNDEQVAQLFTDLEILLRESL
ncbi:SCO family protein [Sphingobacterium deserti]|uniref:Electron transport protein SCO1/SenC n=1 Tax=Sphingobacterium deserti TaxID=1229276 RepID=A0A0B8T5L3_9SPHI|nr:SCO family protein [Sphingobacterium deserti]KGE15913.1 electron transport protein SCO1/SenC [Sphingobacterium deserti]